MKALVVLTLSTALLLSSQGPVWGQQQRPQSRVPEGATTKIYKSIGTTHLNLYVYGLPKQDSPAARPAIVFFFGGGWRSGTPRQFEQHCRYLASRGMIAITADYRVSSRHKTKALQAVKDAKSAIRWIRSNAIELGIDPIKSSPLEDQQGATSPPAPGSFLALANRMKTSPLALNRTLSSCSIPRSLSPQ